MNPIACPGLPAGRSVGKTRPTLCSVPLGMALGSNVMVAGGPILSVTTRERPDGSGWDRQRRPSVTFTGMRARRHGDAVEGAAQPGGARVQPARVTDRS